VSECGTPGAMHCRAFYSPLGRLYSAHEAPGDDRADQSLKDLAVVGQI
jgi:hypothetical protein